MRARGDDGGSGALGAAAGLLAIVLFLVLAVQVLLGLYATTVVRATLHDAASRAANRDAAFSPAALERISGEAAASLGEMGNRTEMRLAARDLDGDGLPDVVAGAATSVPPRVVPASVGGMVGFEHIRVGVRVRVERPR